MSREYVFHDHNDREHYHLVGDFLTPLGPALYERPEGVIINNRMLYNYSLKLDEELSR